MTNDLEFIRGYLATRRELWTQIAEETQVARRAIAYIVDDLERDPRHSTVMKLLGWIRSHEPKAARGRSDRQPA